MCTQGVPATSQLPRLSRIQYDNTIRDLFQLTAVPAQPPSFMLAPDNAGSVDQRAWDGYRTSAETLSVQLMGDAATRSRVIGCTPTGDADAACARTFIENFGRRAFRRPLTAAEVNRFLAFHTNRMTITATGAFNDVATAIVRAFLASPSFLTRAEIAETSPEGANYRLNSWEIASRLSYMLWGTMPDQALFDAATANTLTDPAEILRQAQRMVMDTKARGKVSEFHQAYAHMGEGTRWVDFDRDRSVYPAYTPNMVTAMADETKRFFEYIFFEKGNGTFKDLFTSQVGFVNATLAPFYGLSASSYSTGLTQVNLDATRAGVFTRVGFLTAYALYDRPSPIHRGAFLQKDVLCWQAPGSIPEGAESTALPPGTTNRERVTGQTSGAACGVCHLTAINPMGFALEGFDAVGAARPTEAGMPTNTASDVLISGAVVPVTGAPDLMQKIADSPAAQMCYAKKLVQYNFERVLTGPDFCTAEGIADKIKNQSGYTLVSMLTDLTQTQVFRSRAKETP
jgi:hypothetical protein